MDMKELGVWEPYEVKVQTIKTAIESATLLLRIDDILSGIQKKNKPGPGQSAPKGPQVEDAEVRTPALPSRPGLHYFLCVGLCGMKIQLDFGIGAWFFSGSSLFLDICPTVLDVCPLHVFGAMCDQFIGAKPSP